MPLGAVGAAIVILAAQDGAGVGTSAVPYAPAPAPPPGASACPEGVCGEAALTGLFEALSATETGARERPVHIVQIGDSHTAGDRISGALRARLQARFGAAGRGVLPPGVPYAGYAPLQIEVTAQAWPTTAPPLVLPGETAAPAEAVGAAGARAAPSTGGRMTLAAESGAAFDRVGFCGLGGPQGGRVSVEISGVEASAHLRSPEAGPLCWSRRLPDPARLMTLEAETPAVLYSVWTQRDAAGVVVSSLGSVGATLRDFAARDEAVLGVELAVWRPSLIILAFGVNDGFDNGLEPWGYAETLKAQIDRLRRLAPQASILILGAPEGLKAGQDGPCGGRSAPASLAVVRDVQRRAAGETGVAFWDWYGRMGGECSTERLATLPEPYVRPDRVHFTSVGADWIGGVLGDDLLAAYGRWKAAKGEAD